MSKLLTRTVEDFCLYRIEGKTTAGALDPDLPGLVGAAGWARLSPAIRRRFRVGHGASAVLYDGSMRLERSVLGALFALAAAPLGRPLPYAARAAAPAEVRVRGDGRGGIVWERALCLSEAGPPLVVRSTKQRDDRLGLVERVDGGLGMALAVYEDRGALVFESRAYFLHLGRLRLPLPALLTPGRCRVEHADAGPGRFRFTMTMVHPLWGRTFLQDGIFNDPEEATPCCPPSPS